MKYQNSVKKPGPPIKPKPATKSIGDKEPINVFCRLRPLRNPSDSVFATKLSDQLLELTSSTVRQVYKFNHVFDDQADQNKVFDLVAYPLVRDLMRGQNSLIFSYGVTSSGKTHTITGTPQEPGILPRTLDTIFNTLNKNSLQSIKYVFKVDNQNGFDFMSTPDAIMQIQKESNRLTPMKYPALRTPRSTKKRDLGTVEWENRVQADQFVKDINCDNNYAVFVSFVEVYNNYIYDLLDDSFDLITADGSSAPKSKRIMEDTSKRNYVHGVKEIEVKSSNEAFDLCIKGMKRRRIGNTHLNLESSRSHSVFNIRLVQAPLDMEGVEMIENKKYIRVSQLSIVDLAGCERTARTLATGNRLREASNINNSLLTLRNCFDILRENQKFNANKMIPYRDSKLTHLFRSFFEGDGKVEMIICINPGMEDCEETQQVCKFAETSQELTTNKTVYRYPFRNIMFQETNVNLASTINVGPNFPKRPIETPEDGEVITEWIEILEKRQSIFEINTNLNKENQKVVRAKIERIERELFVQQQQNSVLRMDLDARENQLKEYENKFSQIQRAHDDIEKKLRQQIQELQDELSIVHGKVIQLDSLNSKLQTDYNNLKKHAKDFWTDECRRMQQHYINKMKQKEIETERKLFNNKEKLDIVRKIIDNDDIEFEYPDWMLSPNGKIAKINGQQTTTNKTISEQIDVKAPPVVNPRFDRGNMKQDGCKWIDHRPPGTLELGTVMQPKIKSKKRKSVSNLKASNFIGANPGSASKYSVIHHQAVENGNIKTQVFKGQVVPSSTGGAQVIFNDVETLIQSPPLAQS